MGDTGPVQEITMGKTPYRPIHTGSARVQARNAAAQATRRPPTHLITRHGAVAIEREHESVPAMAVRRARRPLAMAGGRQALALRQQEGQAMEVLVRTQGGQVGWRSTTGLLTSEVLRAWVREGFG